MSKKSNPLLDCLNMIKQAMPSDLKNASAEDLTKALGSLKDMANDMSKEMNENASQSVKDKYNDGFDALDKMIQKGIDDPTSDIDTQGLDEYISAAKGSKEYKKMEEELDK